MNSPAPAVSVEGLVKSYGDVEAVRGIDFEVPGGETFGFLGPNGAGKSTTINMLCTVAYLRHSDDMARTRVSTTVDEELLRSARQACSTLTDAALLDQALTALLDRHRPGTIDAAYTAYDEHPLEEPDAWGDLASFREAAAPS